MPGNQLTLLCLEGSTPQDRSGADTQTAPVGRCMCGIPYPGCRFALPWAKRLLPFQGAYLAGLSTGQVLIYVYRLAIDAKTLRGDGGGG